MPVPWRVSYVSYLMYGRNLLYTAYFFKTLFRRFYILILVSMGNIYQALEMEFDYFPNTSIHVLLNELISVFLCLLNVPTYLILYFT